MILDRHKQKCHKKKGDCFSQERTRATFKFLINEWKINSLVPDLVSLQNLAAVPACSDNHHLDGRHESVPQRANDLKE